MLSPIVTIARLFAHQHKKLPAGSCEKYIQKKVKCLVKKLKITGTSVLTFFSKLCKKLIVNSKCRFSNYEIPNYENNYFYNRVDGARKQLVLPSSLRPLGEILNQCL